MCDKITIIAAKHPFKDEWLEPCVLDHGQTLRQIVGEKARVQAWIDGVEVPCELLDSTVPDAGSEVIVRPVPADGNILRPVFQTVVTIVAAVAGFAVGGPWGVAVGVGIALGGTLAINALVPPQVPETADYSGAKNKLTSLTGSRNKLGAFTNIPRIYGTYRLFPPVPMTATPYTEVVGSDQYLRMFLCLGYGPLEIGGLRAGDGSRITHNDLLPDGTIRIGDSDIGLFEDVEYEIAAAEDITTFTDSVTEDSFSIVLNTDGDQAVRTTGPDCKEASIDIVYPQGLYNISNKGKIRDSSVTWSLQYRAAGTLDEWSALPDVTHGFHHGPVRYGIRWEFPSAGQWDVRLTRASTYNSRDTHYNDATWTTLRTVENTKPFDVPGTVCMALRIKATDQLSGPLETVNILASSLLQVYNGSAWVEQNTSNPAWVYADIFAGTANAEAIPRGDISTAHLMNWASRCDALGLEYNGVFDSNTTVFEAARQVASTGRAAWNLTDDAKISVVTDDPAATQKMVISPRNSWGLSSTVAFQRIPHALRVQYVDSETWEDAERLVFDDGYSEANATRYETYQTKGVTSRDQAWKEGRYHLAQARLRPETFSFMQDVQHLRYRRGDLLVLNHDVILVGIGAGRVKSISGNDLTVDELFDTEVGASYGIKLQKQDGSISVYTVASLTDNVLTLNEAPTGVAVGDHFVFGEAGKETIDVKVSKIEPQGDFAARITCVPAAPNIHDADTGAIPPYSPGMATPKDPPVPTIINVRSDETVLEPDTDGRLKLGMSVMWQVSGSSVQDYGVELRLRPTSTAAAWRTITVTSPQNKTYFVQGVFTDIEYEIQARTTYQGRFSAWSTAVTHTVQGVDTGPVSVTGLVFHTDGSAANFRDMRWTWTPSEDPKFLNYKVEIRSGSTLRRTEYVDTPEYLYTLDKNRADGLSGNITVRVYVQDRYGNLSDTYAEDTVTADSPPPPTGVAMIGGGQIYASSDVSFVWNDESAAWFKRYRVEIWSGGVQKRVEYVSDPAYTYTWAKNNADGLTRSVEIRVWLEDVFGNISPSPAGLIVNNPQVGQVQNVTIDDGYLGATVKWDEIVADDLAGYVILFSTDDVSYGVAGRVGPGTTSASFNGLPGGALYAKVGAYDFFGTEGITYSLAAVGSVDIEAPATDPEEFKKEATEAFSVPILHGYSFTAGAAAFSWNAHSLYHNGEKYPISAGSTANKYVWWDVASPGAYQSGATRPPLNQSAGQFHIAVYYGAGDWDLVWHAAPNQVVGSGYFQRASINTAHIDHIDASTANITNIWADKIKVGGSPVAPGALAIKDQADYGEDVVGGPSADADNTDRYLDTVNPNMVKNPTAKLGNSFWSGDALPHINSDGSPYWGLNSATPATRTHVSDLIPVQPSWTYTLGATIYSLGLQSGNFNVDLQAYDSNQNQIFYNPRIITNTQHDFQRKTLTTTTPAGTAYLQIRFYLENAVSSNTAVKNIKLESGSTATRFVGEEQGADVTKDNTANDVLTGPGKAVAEPGADKTQSALEAHTEITTGGLKMTNTGTGDYVHLTPGDLRFYENGMLYKSVRRVFAGEASGGDIITFNPPMKDVPIVQVSPKITQVPAGTNEFWMEFYAKNVTINGFEVVANLMDGFLPTTSTVNSITTSVGGNTSITTVYGAMGVEIFVEIAGWDIIDWFNDIGYFNYWGSYDKITYRVYYKKTTSSTWSYQEYSYSAFSSTINGHIPITHSHFFRTDGDDYQFYIQFVSVTTHTDSWSIYFGSGEPGSVDVAVQPPYVEFSKYVRSDQNYISTTEDVNFIVVEGGGS